MSDIDGTVSPVESDHGNGPDEAIRFEAPRVAGVSGDVFADTLQVSAVALISLIAIFAAKLLADVFGWPVLRPVSLAAICAFGIATLWFTRRHGWRGRKSELFSATCIAGNAQDRITCIGERSVFRTFGEFTDVAFEPTVFFAPVGFHMKRSTRRWLALGQTIALLALALVVKHVVFSPWWDWGANNGMVGALLIMSSALVGAGMEAAMFPVYIRIVPGRMDIMEFFAWSAKARVVRSYDLRESRIVLELKSMRVFIGGTEDKVLSIALVPRRMRVAYMLLLAALSSHTAAPLPANRLV